MVYSILDQFDQKFCKQIGWPHLAILFVYQYAIALCKRMIICYERNLGKLLKGTRILEMAR